MSNKAMITAVKITVFRFFKLVPVMALIGELWLTTACQCYIQLLPQKYPSSIVTCELKEENSK